MSPKPNDPAPENQGPLTADQPAPRSPIDSTDDEFIRLFSKSQCALHSFILGVTYDRSAADDLLQEVNLALWRKRGSYNHGQDFLRWALGFARIEVKNHRSKRAKSPLLFSDDALTAVASEWPTNLRTHHERLEALAACVKKLGEIEQRFLQEFYRENTTVRELAESNTMPATTVYKVLSRARKALRSCVNQTLAQASHPA